jgi:hypothetical protein
MSAGLSATSSANCYSILLRELEYLLHAYRLKLLPLDISDSMPCYTVHTRTSSSTPIHYVQYCNSTPSRVLPVTGHLLECRILLFCVQEKGINCARSSIRCTVQLLLVALDYSRLRYFSSICKRSCERTKGYLLERRATSYSYSTIISHNITIPPSSPQQPT